MLEDNKSGFLKEKKIESLKCLKQEKNGVSKINLNEALKRKKY